ncbi:MAG: hypothetical protein OEW45_19540 [Deltaproteobacteria bacterium]|nr:hypothetical protein [Deltaproteobacteria bacterium]
MKAIHADLCRLINALEAICGTLDSLRKGMETTTPRLPVDDYYKFLLATERIRETIAILRKIIEKTESVISTT